MDKKDTWVQKQLDANKALKEGLNRLAAEPIKAVDYVSPLENDVMVAKGSKALPEALTTVKGKIIPDQTKSLVKGATDIIDNSQVQKVISGNDFQKKLASILESRAAAKLAKTAGTVGEGLSTVAKKIPMLGGLAVGLGTALATGDASAAVPILNEADELGPIKGSIEHKLESGIPLSQEEMALLNKRK